MRFLYLVVLLSLITACKHPLAVQGEGDIVERLEGVRGCTFEQSQAGHSSCTENAVVDEPYKVSYQPVPRPGWGFVRWEGTGCSHQSNYPLCEYDVPRNAVNHIDQRVPEGFDATIAVFEPLGDVVLSSNSVMPGQPLTLYNEELGVGQVAEVEIHALEGGHMLRAAAVVVEAGEVTLAAPAYINRDGEFAVGAARVILNGDEAVETLFLQAPLPMTVETRGLVWLANAYDSIEDMWLTLDYMGEVAAELDVDVSAVEQEIRSEIQALDAAITLFESDGVVLIESADGQMVELSDEALNNLDTLLLQRAMWMSVVADAVATNAVATLPEDGTRRTAGPFDDSTSLADHLRDKWDAAMNALSRSDAFNDPDRVNADALRDIREVIESVPDVIDRTLSEGGRGVSTFGAYVATMLNGAALFGDAALAEVATAGNAGLAELQAIGRGLIASLRRVNTESLLTRGQEVYSDSLEALTQLGAVLTELGKTQLPQELGLLSGFSDLVNSTEELLSGFGDSLCNYLPSNIFCPAPPVPIAGTYSTTYGTMTLTRSGNRVTGSYDGQDGLIRGRILGNVLLEGVWVEPSAAYACGTAQEGSIYWGNIQFVFSASGFSGHWDYCGEIGGGRWNGTRE